MPSIKDYIKTQKKIEYEQMVDSVCNKEPVDRHKSGDTKKLEAATKQICSENDKKYIDYSVIQSIWGYFKTALLVVIFIVSFFIGLLSIMGWLFPILHEGTQIKAGSITFILLSAIVCFGAWYIFYKSGKALKVRLSLDGKHTYEEDIVIPISRSSVLAAIIFSLLFCLLMTGLIVAGFKSFDSIWEMLFIPFIPLILWYYFFKFLMLLFKKGPGITVNNEGYINYFYKEPKLITWKQLCQGKSIHHGTGNGDSFHIYIRTENGTQTLDERFYYLILKIRPKKFIKILEERCDLYRKEAAA